MQRTETDFLGNVSIEAGAYYGIHAVRAKKNFPSTGEKYNQAFLHSYFMIKKACALLNNRLGYLDQTKAQAIIKACDDNELLCDNIIVDPLAGGAGTSLNMNINEVIANRAGEYLGYEKGSYVIDPIQDVNLHQSTNDTFVTAGKMAVMITLQELVETVIACQNVIQRKESEYIQIKKIARTQLMDAVPILFGQTFGAWAEALSRDRWRLYKAEERIRSVNLGGTAVGNGIGSPREFVLSITDELRKVSKLRIAKAENLIDATQNLDVFVEICGFLKALSVNLYKIANDIRLLGSGPNTAIGEINLPRVQAGSSIMPGKVNPVVPEYVIQVCLVVSSQEAAVSSAVANGNLELNSFAPIVVHYTLKSIYLLRQALQSLTPYIAEITVDENKCRQHIEQSTSVLTPLIHHFGHEAVSQIIVDKNYDIAEIIAEISRAFKVETKDIYAILDEKNITGLGKKNKKI